MQDDPQPISELDKLPPPTQVGKQTFGCLVDGKAWVTERYLDAGAFYQEGVLSITGYNKNSGTIGIYIGLIFLLLTITAVAQQSITIFPVVILMMP